MWSKQNRAGAAVCVLVSVLIAAFLTPAARAQAPITLDRLHDAIDSLQKKALKEADVIQAVLDLGLAFEMTPAIRSDLKKRGATESLLVIFDSKSKRPQTALPAQPVTADQIAAALKGGMALSAAMEHLRLQGPAAAFTADDRVKLGTADSSGRLTSAFAAESLRRYGVGDSVDQLTALLAAGVDQKEIQAGLSGSPVELRALPHVLDQIKGAGGGQPLIHELIRIEIVRNVEPLSLPTLLAALAHGYNQEQLTSVISQRGVTFAFDAESAERLLDAGAADPVLAAIAKRWVENQKDKLSMEQIELLKSYNIADEPVIKAVEANGVSMAFTQELAVRINAPDIGDDLRKAIAVAALASEGYTPMPARQAMDYDPHAGVGQFDLRIHVDHVEEVVIIGDVIMRNALRGSPSSNAGSEMRQPIPRQGILPGSFQIVQMDGRGKFAPLMQPNPDNGSIVRLRIYDDKGGNDRYHLRLTWKNQ